MKLLGGIRDVVGEYDVFLLDMWGVMHDGSRPYGGVPECVRELKSDKSGGGSRAVIVLSNSSRRTDAAVRMLQKLGFEPSDFERIITSGEVAHRRLVGCSEENRKLSILGSGDDDEVYCESAGWTVSTVEEASLLVARGTFTVVEGSNVIHKGEGEAAYEEALRSALRRAAARRLPMLVTNPDKVRPDRERPPMPGRIGDQYERALVESGLSEPQAAGLVTRIGKPFPAVYETALGGRTAAAAASRRACMIGDALETDVTGGTLAGIDTIWVLRDGIHSPDLDPEEEDLVKGASRILTKFNEQTGTYAAGQKLSPTYVMPHFRW
jgi:HAD superfamily hydrolase (TIGR01459 family)